MSRRPHEAAEGRFRAHRCEIPEARQTENIQPRNLASHPPRSALRILQGRRCTLHYGQARPADNRHCGPATRAARKNVQRRPRERGRLLSCRRRRRIGRPAARSDGRRPGPHQPPELARWHSPADKPVLPPGSTTIMCDTDRIRTPRPRTTDSGHDPRNRQPRAGNAPRCGQDQLDWLPGIAVTRPCLPRGHLEEAQLSLPRMWCTTYEAMHDRLRAGGDRGAKFRYPAQLCQPRLSTGRAEHLPAHCPVAPRAVSDFRSSLDRPRSRRALRNRRPCFLQAPPEGAFRFSCQHGAISPAVGLLRLRACLPAGAPARFARRQRIMKSRKRSEW